VGVVEIEGWGDGFGKGWKELLKVEKK